MKQLAVKIAFGAAAVAWGGWSFFAFIFSGMGDCGDDHYCNLARDANQSLQFWRGLAVMLLLAAGYRAVRRWNNVY